MERAQENWVAKASTLSQQVLSAIAQFKKRYQELKIRYGRRYTHAMLSVAFFTLFSPVPGSSLVGIALVVTIAEAHRAISRRGGFAEAIAVLLVMLKANMPRCATGERPASLR